MSATPQVPNSLSNLRFLAGTSTEDAITATASGTQATAYQLSAQMSTITVCATAGDSVALPKIGVRAVADANPGGLGYIGFLWNNGAAAAKVYGVTPDTINGVATATGISLPAGAMLLYWANGYTQSSNVGAWNGAILLSPTTAFTFPGDLTVTGNMTATGAVIAASGNFAANLAVNGDAGIITIPFQAGLATGAVSQTMHIAERPEVFMNVSLSFANASSSGTFMLEKLTGNQSAGNGITMLTGTLNLAGPNNNVVVGTLNATTASITLATGDRAGALFGGTMTSLLGLNVTAKVRPA